MNELKPGIYRIQWRDAQGTNDEWMILEYDGNSWWQFGMDVPYGYPEKDFDFDVRERIEPDPTKNKD